MTNALQLCASDRVFVLAPHPDDESIACGGLLLAAGEAGASCRVVVLTDGDNNPWPQRWMEKRWRIDARARARWGARRQAEARAALDVLGVEDRVFLGWPDMGLTTMLMHEPAHVAQALVAQFDAFRPTHLALPALTDAHPDHSAAHVASRFALARAAVPMPRNLFYSVHGDRADSDEIVALDARWRELKRQAILRHETQMRFSRKRFVGFATATERYRSGEDGHRPRGDAGFVASVSATGEIEFIVAARQLRALHLLLAVDAADGSVLRWRIPLAHDGDVDVHDLIAEKTAGAARWRRDGGHSRLRLATSLTAPMRAGFCKLARNRVGLVVYDRYCWQVLAQKRPEFANT